MHSQPAFNQFNYLRLQSLFFPDYILNSYFFSERWFSHSPHFHIHHISTLFLELLHSPPVSAIALPGRHSPILTFTSFPAFTTFLTSLFPIQTSHSHWHKASAIATAPYPLPVRIQGISGWVYGRLPFQQG